MILQILSLGYKKNSWKKSFHDKLVYQMEYRELKKTNYIDVVEQKISFVHHYWRCIAGNLSRFLGCCSPLNLPNGTRIIIDFSNKSFCPISITNKINSRALKYLFTSNITPSLNWSKFNVNTPIVILQLFVCFSLRFF